MKKTTTKEYNIKTKYICEVCNKTYLDEENAIDCEKTHGCEHKEFEYDFTNANDGINGWWFATYGITKQCKNCKLFFKEADFEDIEDNEILEQIYNLILKK